MARGREQVFLFLLVAAMFGLVVFVLAARLAPVLHSISGVLGS